MNNEMSFDAYKLYLPLAPNLTLNSFLNFLKFLTEMTSDLKWAMFGP